MTTDVWAPYRSILAQGLERAMREIDATHGALVREQVATSAEEVLLPALICLRAAEAIGGKAEVAAPAAVALALLGHMGDVFISLESQDGGASLSTAWGMPRSLNAGDAFFAAAQASVLDRSDELPVGSRLRALDVLDKATMGFVQSLLGPASSGGQLDAGVRALFPGALIMAGIYSKVGDATIERLAPLCESWRSLGPEALEQAIASDLPAALASVRSS